MKNAFWLLAPIITAVIMFGALAYALFKQEHYTVRYDCRMAEISPDFPPDVRNECRRLLGQRALEEMKKSGRI